MVSAGNVAPVRVAVVVNKHLPGWTVYACDSWTPIAQTTMADIAPHEVVLSADGRNTYIPIYGSSGVGQPGTDEHMFYVFDTLTGKRVSVLDTGKFRRLHSLAVGRSGLVYATAEVAGAVIIIDPARNEIIGQIETGSYTTHFLALNREETKIYCSNVQSKTVSILDVGAGRLQKTIETGEQNQRMTISPDGRWFVTNLGPARAVAFYRTEDECLDFTVPVDGTPFVAKFSPDGRYLYDAGLRDKEVNAWKIDCARREVVATMRGLGGNTGSLEVNPFDGTVCVSDQPTNRITVLEPNKWMPVRTVETAASPDAMAFGLVR